MVELNQQKNSFVEIFKNTENREVDWQVLNIDQNLGYTDYYGMAPPGAMIYPVLLGWHLLQVQCHILNLMV